MPDASQIIRWLWLGIFVVWAIRWHALIVQQPSDISAISLMKLAQESQKDHF
jgi:hypothetical protein